MRTNIQEWYTNKSPWDLGSVFLLFLILVTMLITAGDYGESYDEELRQRQGEKKYQYYAQLLTGDFHEAAEIGRTGDNYPGFHDLNLALLRRISPFSDRITGNLFSCMFGFLTLVGTWKLTGKISNSRSAFWGLLLLMSLPAFYGHSFINPKDIPFACGYIWSVYFIADWLRKNGIPPWRTTVLSGVAIGIAMATRIGGLVLYCYLGLFATTCLIFELKAKSPQLSAEGIFKLATSLSSRLAVAGLIAMAVLLVYWPYGQMAPLSRTTTTLESISAFNWDMPVLFEGNFYTAPDLPFYYIIKMLVIKVPVLTVIMFLLGTGYTVFEYLRTCRNNRFAPNSQLLVIFAVLFPVAYVILRDSILYNGLRHLLFILPPLCVISGIGVDKLFSHIRSKRSQLFIPATAGILGFLLLTLFNMVRLHPYQYIYYNELVGGTAAAAPRFETDYWGTVYKELGEDFMDYLRREHPVFSRPEVIVNTEHATWLLRPFIPDNTSLPIRVVRSSPQNDDYYISSTLWGADRFYAGEPVVQVERMGIPLGVVKDRRNLSQKERGLGYSN